MSYSIMFIMIYSGQTQESRYSRRGEDTIPGAGEVEEGYFDKLAEGKDTIARVLGAEVRVSLVLSIAQ